MLGKLKKLVPITVKYWLYENIYSQNIELPQGKRVFIFLSADYGNIGDIAISKAQELFLRKHCPDRSVVVIPISRTRQLVRSIGRQIQCDDLITIIGGGNMGSLYPDIELLRQLVIKSFSGNRILCFPQTLDNDGSKRGNDAHSEIRRVYSSHPNITVFARESVTRDTLRRLFLGCGTVHVEYSPDVVLSCSSSDFGVEPNRQRSGILFCMRNDKERMVSEQILERIRKTIESHSQPMTVTDTHVEGHALTSESSSVLLHAKLQQFASSKLVVTDRLHGMILAAISNTPCLVLPNSNHKIRQTYLDWLSNYRCLKFIESDEADQINVHIEKLLSQTIETTDSLMDSDAFERLAKAVCHEL